MTISINHKPTDPSFVADGIAYQIILTPGTGEELDHKPTPITFRIQEGSNEAENITLLCFPSVDTQGRDILDIELTDILSALTARYQVSSGLRIVSGYAAVKVWQVGNTDVTDAWAIVLPGTAGGLQLTGALPEGVHPFLIARGEEEGALHLYRSELAAMEYIFAIAPDAYTGHSIQTDDSSLDIYSTVNVDLSSTVHYIFGIFLNASGTSNIATSASALFVGYTDHDDEQRMNTIAIVDDPDTDEACLIRWTNSMGAPEALLLTGEPQDTSEIEKPELYIHNQSIRSTERKMQRGTVTTKYSLHTGYLTPARIIALKDMLTSDEIEMQIDGQWVPVSITADTSHAVHQREPESFELTIEVLEQTRYHKPNRTVRPLPDSLTDLLQDNSGNIILDNNSNTIQENG